MSCFAALLKEYKGEVEDILVADKQVGVQAGRRADRHVQHVDFPHHCCLSPTTKDNCLVSVMSPIHS